MVTIPVIKIIGWSEILGGVLGTILALNIMEGSFLIYLLILFLFISSFISGLMLIKDKKLGYIFSIIIQIFQIPRIISSRITYIFLAGPTINLNFYKTVNTFELKSSFWIFSSNFHIGFNNNLETFMIGFNVLALLIIIYLLKEYKSKHTDLKISESSTF